VAAGKATWAPSTQQQQQQCGSSSSGSRTSTEVLGVKPREGAEGGVRGLAHILEALQLGWCVCGGGGVRMAKEKGGGPWGYSTKCTAQEWCRWGRGVRVSLHVEVGSAGAAQVN